MSSHRDALLDVDGVLADLLSEWLRLYNADFDDGLRPADILGWDLRDFVKPAARDHIASYLDLPTLYVGVWPVPGALSSVRALRARGYRVTYVTHCTSATMLEGKVEWLRGQGFLADPRNVGKRLPDDLIVASRKDVFTGQFMVDDYWRNLTGFRGLPILFDAPYNQAIDSVSPRAVGWAEVLRIVDRIDTTEPRSDHDQANARSSEEGQDAAGLREAREAQGMPGVPASGGSA